MKKLTKAQIDKQILDHADEIIKLMKLKGFKDESSDMNYDHIQIWIQDDVIEVQHVCQSITTKKRKKK
jgi:phosphoribosyl-ATP pyrophosphohydrolase